MIEIEGREIHLDGRVLRIASLHGDGFRFVDDPAGLIDGLRRSGKRADLFTFSQRVPDAAPKFSYPCELESLAVLPVTTFEHWWSRQIGNKTRNEVRLSEKKGVVVREVAFNDALIKGIWDIYNESPIRQRRRFPHYGKDREQVRREEATFLDSSVFIGAFVADQMIGFAKLVPDETFTQAGLMNILSMLKHRDKAPQNALIASAVRACASRGIKYLVYSRFDYGKGRQDGLRRFKEHNGFEECVTPRFYVPLTVVGLVGYRLGLHRRLGERIPEALAAKLRDLRAAWYERKYRL